MGGADEVRREVKGHLAQLLAHPKLHNLEESKELRVRLAGLGQSPPAGTPNFTRA